MAPTAPKRNVLGKGLDVLFPGAASSTSALSARESEIGTAESRHEALSKRLLGEGVHQMGLIRGLAHCPNNRCVMFLSSTIQDTDKKGVQFCANCRKRLATEV